MNPFILLYVTICNHHLSKRSFLIFMKLTSIISLDLTICSIAYWVLPTQNLPLVTNVSLSFIWSTVSSPPPILSNRCQKVVANVISGTKTINNTLLTRVRWDSVPACRRVRLFSLFSFFLLSWERISNNKSFFHFRFYMH